MGVTAILLTCSYNNQEFFRCGYYVNNIFDNEEMNLNPPEIVDIQRVMRNVLCDKPRITKFNIDWDSNVNVIQTSYNNFMFSDKENNQNIQNEFYNLNKGHNLLNNGLGNEEQVKNLFYNMNNLNNN